MRLLLLLTAAVVLVVIVELYRPRAAPTSVVADEATQGPPPAGSYHRPATLPRTAAGRQVRYGRELIAHTAQYLGPRSSVAYLTNGMNCQSCHLQAGTQGFANNYLAPPAPAYPPRLAQP